MEEDFYATIKLKNGEELFSKVNTCKEKGITKLILINPITIEAFTNRNGMKEYKISSWLKTTTEDMFIVNLNDILTMTETSDLEMIMLHESYVNKTLRLLEDPKVLSRKMGYLSSVTEAKKLLEKIYKNS